MKYIGLAVMAFGLMATSAAAQTAATSAFDFRLRADSVSSSSILRTANSFGIDVGVDLSSRVRLQVGITQANISPGVPFPLDTREASLFYSPTENTRIGVTVSQQTFGDLTFDGYGINGRWRNGPFSVRGQIVEQKSPAGITIRFAGVDVTRSISKRWKIGFSAVVGSATPISPASFTDISGKVQFAIADGAYVYAKATYTNNNVKTDQIATIGVSYVFGGGEFFNLNRTLTNFVVQGM